MSARGGVHHAAWRPVRLLSHMFAGAGGSCYQINARKDVEAQLAKSKRREKASAALATKRELELRQAVEDLADRADASKDEVKLLRIEIEDLKKQVKSQAARVARRDHTIVR